MEFLKTVLEPELLEQLRQLLPRVRALDDRFRFPLAEFAVPALRENDAVAHAHFSDTLQRLLECDDAIDLFAYALIKMVGRRLAAHFEGVPVSARRPGRVEDVLPECALLLSALAHVGSDGDEAEARQAFATGRAFLDTQSAQVQFLSRREWDLAQVDAALAKLAGYHEPLKMNVLLACGKTVAADGQVTVREAELLRAIADSLDCPMPPFVEALRADAFGSTQTVRTKT